MKKCYRRAVKENLPLFTITWCKKLMRPGYFHFSLVTPISPNYLNEIFTVSILERYLYIPGDFRKLFLHSQDFLYKVIYEIH